MAIKHSPSSFFGVTSPFTHPDSGRRQSKLLLPLLGLAVILAGAATQAGTTAKTTRQPVSSDQKVTEAQKSVPSPELIRKTRLEFDKLSLQMIGMTTIMDETTALIKYPGAKETMFCTVGQVVGGFKIISIQSEYTVFEGNGIRIWLALGTSDDTGSVGVEAGEMGEEPGESAETKEAESLKTYWRNGKPVSDSGIVKNVREEIITYNGKPVNVASLSSGGKNPKFMTPVAGRVTSGFGYRKQPTGGARKYHQGIDMQGKIGTPIVSAAEGVIEEVSRSWAKGLNILVRHNDGYHTAYFHLSKTLVKAGQKVKQGDKIGLLGNTGITTGPHLHFEIHKSGVPVDPALHLKNLKK